MKPDLKLIQGAKVDVEIVETPERIDFPCHSCGRNCVLYPKAKPLAVQHALPECSEWKKEETAAFLAKSGAHIHVPKESN